MSVYIHGERPTTGRNVPNMSTFSNIIDDLLNARKSCHPLHFGHKLGCAVLLGCGCDMLTFQHTDLGEIKFTLLRGKSVDIGMCSLEFIVTLGEHS